jgi:hypothetical protein
MNQQRYFKKMGIIVWNAGKNEHTPFIKVVVQSQAEEPGYQPSFITTVLYNKSSAGL